MKKEHEEEWAELEKTVSKEMIDVVEKSDASFLACGYKDHMGDPAFFVLASKDSIFINWLEKQLDEWNRQIDYQENNLN